MSSFKSKLRVVSIGIAAENKPLSSHWLSIVPIEMTPNIDGDLLDEISTAETSGVNKEGKTYTVEVKSSAALRAHWLPFGANRVTSPDVRRGERLLIWQYGDTDKYYWSPLGMDDDLRRMETVIYAWSATPNEDDELELGKNMYSLEVSGHGKHITLKTTKANDEPYAYTIQLNAKDGIFFVSDDNDNVISLDSTNTTITAINRDQTKVTLEKKKLNAYAKDEINFKCDGILKGYVAKRAEIDCDGPFIARAPEMQFGMDDAVQPSVLGDNHAAGHEDLESQINASQVIGNLGIPTSPIQAVKPVSVASLNAGGNSYSTVNKNQ